MFTQISAVALPPPEPPSQAKFKAHGVAKGGERGVGGRVRGDRKLQFYSIQR